MECVGVTKRNTCDSFHLLPGVLFMLFCNHVTVDFDVKIDFAFANYMTDFILFARLNLPSVQINIAKKISIANVLPRVLMYQNRQVSLPVEYKTATL